MLLVSQSVERLLVARDTVVFLLQHLGFVINCHGTGTNNRILRSCDKFDSNGPFFNRRENERNFAGMQNNIFNKRDNGFAANTISRSCIIHHTSSSSSSRGGSRAAATSKMECFVIIVNGSKHFPRFC